jgi:chemotaxis protein histidine kinase CheA
VNKPIPPHLVEAHAIFKTELESHLGYLKTAFEKLSAEQSGAQLEPDKKEELYVGVAHRLHLLKGGAGFLGLDEIRDSATETEKAYAKKTRGNYQPSAAIALLEGTVKTLEKAHEGE